MTPAERIEDLDKCNGLRYVYGIGDLKKIWAECGFGSVTTGNLSHAQIRFIETHLIRTISFLTYIGYPDHDISKLIMKWIQTEEEFDEKLIKGDSLAQFKKKGRDFERTRQLFTAPILTEDTETILLYSQRMPFNEDDNNKPDKEQHEIANGHLKLKNNVRII